ncbi:secretion protein, partial [Streptomyces sp. C1-2]|nr:secretion protein [Streptomyces sp. C1-2]
LHLVRGRDGRRRIAEVHVLERDAAGWVVTVPALRWGRAAFTREEGWQRLRALLHQAGAAVGGDEDPPTDTRTRTGEEARAGWEAGGGRALGAGR